MERREGNRPPIVRGSSWDMVFPGTGLGVAVDLDASGYLPQLGLAAIPLKQSELEPFRPICHQTAELFLVQSPNGTS
jgi:hypothetical protein